MIAVMIQCHTRLDRVRRLIDWIYNPSGLYIVVYDQSGGHSLDLGELTGLPENVVIRPAIPTLWGGISIVRSTLEAMRLALSLSGRWTHFINLSGSDVPLADFDRIGEVLKERGRRGEKNFIADFGAPTLDWFCASAPDDAPQDIRRPDVTIEAYGEAAPAFASLAQTPIRRPERRAAVVCAEDFAGRRLVIRPPTPAQRQSREAFLAEHPFRFGRQWIVASRDLCTFLCESPRAAQVLAGLDACFIPDESFFQMAVRAAGEAVVAATSNDNLRLGRGEPMDITDAMLPALQASPALFARKLAFDRAPKIDAWLDQRHNRPGGFWRRVARWRPV